MYLTANKNLASVRSTGHGTAAAGRPRLGFLYILCVPVCAGVATARGVDIAGLNYTGWIWMAQLVGALLLLLAEKALRPTSSRIAFPVRPWLVWCWWVWFSLVWCEDVGPQNVQDALQMTMPLLVGVVASAFVRTEAQMKTLLCAYCVTVIPLTLSLVVTWLDLLPGVDMRTGLRPLGISLGLSGCVFLARFPKRLVIPLAGWGGCLMLSFASGGRTNTLAILAVFLFHPLVKGVRWRMILLIGMMLVGLGLFYTPAFQQRFFYSGSGTLSDLASGNFSGSGRFTAWPLIWEEAWRRPVLGTGIGSAYDFVPTVWPGINHVHNDYLRVGFELGICGLALFLAVHLWQLAALRRKAARTDGVTRHGFVASFLGMVLLFLTATTCNPLIYNVWFTNPLFALIGASYGVAARQQSRAGP